MPEHRGDIVRFPIEPETVTVLGSIWHRGTRAWDGLDFTRAKVRTQSTLMIYVCGSADAPYDLHLDVPFCHPDDHPTGPKDYDCVYRVRPRAEPGKRWRGRLVRAVTLKRAPGKSPPWEIEIEFAGRKRAKRDA